MVRSDIGDAGQYDKGRRLKGLRVSLLESKAENVGRGEWTGSDSSAGCSTTSEPASTEARQTLGASNLDQVTFLNRVNAMTIPYFSIIFEDCGDAGEGKIQRWSGVTHGCFRARAQPHLCIMQDETGVTYAISFSSK